jgi:FAD/FMN-containing dehydrogenase
LKASAVQSELDANTATDTTAAATAPLTTLSGWGRYPIVRGHERRGEDLEHLTAGAALTRGLGRSYGDSSLPASDTDTVVASPLADRLLRFDATTGVVRAEAGFPLWRLNRLFLLRGWFTPVTPGTHYVTLGGMVAADVHGKSHHRDGCFGEHVTALKMRVADGRVLECSDEHERELFGATLGGMGLTGHILEVEFRMHRIPSPWIWQESERLADFDSLLDALQASGKTWPMTVCWADFLGSGSRLGRGLLAKGRWAEPSEAPPQPPRFRRAPSLPPIVPSWFLQRWMGQAFNWLVYHRHGARPRVGIVHPETFFYPLDVIRNWNHVYGKRGFTQYQCVLPSSDNHASHHRLLRVLQAQRANVFICVVKDCGPQGKGMLSFPRPGITYALDIPISPRIQSIVDALNELVIAEGGRIYLAKDALTRAEHYRAMDPRLDAWESVRRKWDPHGTLRSAQSVRVFGDRP